LSRVLSEIELERVCETTMSGAEARLLVAGGGRAAGGSEHVALDRRVTELPTVFVDLRGAREPDVVADLTAGWPFHDAAFDVVMSTWVVEHVSDPVTYFSQAFRVLRSPGVYVCAVPFLYRQHGAPADFFRFTDDALVHLASTAGFDRIEIARIGGTPLTCCVNILWPFLGMPLLGLLAFVSARALDQTALGLARLAGRRREVLRSCPIAHVLVAHKLS
jgi:SAM-dependent methyltransferase